MSEVDDLARAAGRGPLAGDDAAGYEQLSRALADARASVPQLPLCIERLGNALDEHLDPEAPIAAAAALRLGELHLARAALDGVAGALHLVSAMLPDAAIPVLSARGFQRDEIDELLQEVRLKLLAAEGDERPGLASYSGRGTLGGFLRTAAVRTALNRRRGEQRRERRERRDALVALESVIDAPELQHMKTRYLQQFRAALTFAFEQLDPEHRLFLQHQLEDGLTIDDLAQLYGIHRATAARRLRAARDALGERTRSQLAHVLGLGQEDVESVMRLIASRLGDAADALAR